MAPSELDRPARVNLRWLHRGGPLEELLDAAPEEAPLPPPGPDEVIAGVEAVSICSSDLKIVRMGPDHPLVAQNAGGADTVLGHEMSLRVVDVGSSQAGRFRKGQRLGVQPAMRINGKRHIIGFDVPGGFAQYLRLGPEALADYVFEVPEALTAAEIALLEPYGCVERAYRPNARHDFRPDGRALVVLGPNAARYRASAPLRWRETVVVGEPPPLLPDFLGPAAQRAESLEALAGSRFDDILALGDLPAADLAQVPPLLAEGGLFLQARQAPTGPVDVDPARVHYDALSFVGTSEEDILQALAPERRRYEVREGGVALVYGAGGAMGRIHVHRLLQLERGPRTVIATTRKGQRLADLQADFGPIAAERQRNLLVVDTASLGGAVKSAAPLGLDDVIVVAPDSDAVALTAEWLAPDGMLAVFAGFPYGRNVPFDLAGIAITGKRLTGSTGCSVDDMKDVLSRVVAGDIDLSANLKAVAGLKALPQALDAVNRGTVSGKIVIYPQAPHLPFRRVTGGWRASDEDGLTDPSGRSGQEDREAP